MLSDAATKTVKLKNSLATKTAQNKPSEVRETVTVTEAGAVTDDVGENT